MAMPGIRIMALAVFASVTFVSTMGVPTGPGSGGTLAGSATEDAGQALGDGTGNSLLDNPGTTPDPESIKGSGSTADSGEGPEPSKGPSGEEPSGEESSEEQPSGEEPSEEEPSTSEPSGEEPSQPSREEPSGEEPSTSEPSWEEPSEEEPFEVQPSGVEPSPTEPSGEEHSEEESSGEEPSGAEPSQEEPSGEEPSGEEPSGGEPSWEEPSEEEPSGEEPSGEEPSGAEPSQEEPSGEEPSNEQASDESFDAFLQSIMDESDSVFNELVGNGTAADLSSLLGNGTAVGNGSAVGNLYLADVSSLLGNGTAVGNGSAVGNRVLVDLSSLLGNGTAVGNGSAVGNRVLVDLSSLLGNGTAVGNGSAVGNRIVADLSSLLGNGTAVGNGSAVGNRVLADLSSLLGNGTAFGNGTVVGNATVQNLGSLVGYGTAESNGTAVGDGTTVGDGTAVGDGTVVGHGSEGSNGTDAMAEGRSSDIAADVVNDTVEVAGDIDTSGSGASGEEPSDETLNALLDSVMDGSDSVFNDLPSDSSSDKPNIIYILADDMGYHDVGFQNEEVISPTLDALARGGVILDQAYAQSTCTPSRSALMTSVYPYKSKMQHGVLGDLNPGCVPLDMTFLPERLRAHGYLNHMLGKWHLGFCRDECLPTRRGFDTFYGLWTGAETFYTHMSGGSDLPGYDWRDQEEIDYSANGTYHSDLLATRAVQLIEESGDDPFFMYLSYTNPHTPLEVPEKYWNMYDESLGRGRQVLLGMVTAMDDSIAEVMKALRAAGKDDNTIIVFSSDNGGDSHRYADNGPIRGFKGSMFEGGSRVPAFINAPSLQKTGNRHDGLFHIADWGPTLMSMIGVPIAVSEGLDGVDQSAMLETGGPSARHEMVYNFDLESGPHFGQAALRVGDWKLIWGPEGWGVGRGVGNATEFYKSEENQRLIAEFQSQAGPDTQRRKRRATELLSRHKRAEVWFTYQDIMDMQTIFAIKSFDTETLDVDTGFKYLFNLRDDPSEYHNLANSPDHRDEVLSLQYRMRQLLNDYVAPEPYRGTKMEQGKPKYYSGTYSSGWCDHFDMDL